MNGARDPASGDALRAVESYYATKVRAHGATHRGVDWGTRESQLLRFEKLLALCAERGAFSIVDYGCGYGALLEALDGAGARCAYVGYDISEEMLARARQLHGRRPDCAFTSDAAALAPADYVVASGIFNVKVDAAEDVWRAHVLATLDRFHELSTGGFAFNALSSYSDVERRRRDLHYADPLALFDHCKRRYSRFVTLLHDYPLYEFTLIVRK